MSHICVYKVNLNGKIKFIHVILFFRDSFCCLWIRKSGKEVDPGEFLVVSVGGRSDKGGRHWDVVGEVVAVSERWVLW